MHGSLQRRCISARLAYSKYMLRKVRQRGGGGSLGVGGRSKAMCVAFACYSAHRPHMRRAARAKVRSGGPPLTRSLYRSHPSAPTPSPSQPSVAANGLLSAPPWCGPQPAVYVARMCCSPDVEQCLHCTKSTRRGAGLADAPARAVVPRPACQRSSKPTSEEVFLGCVWWPETDEYKVTAFSVNKQKYRWVW